ncbi:MAG: ATP-binding protein [Planctomycetota bacterium]
MGARKKSAMGTIGRKATQTELFLQSVLDSIEDRVNIVDRDYRIIYANAALLRHCGKPREAIIGQNCYKVYWGHDGPCEPCITPLTFSTAKPQHASQWVKGPDGKDQCIERFTFPIIEKGKVKYVIECLRDVTVQRSQEHRAREQAKELAKRIKELRRAYRERQLVREQLIHAERMASIGQTTSSMAHELDTPLSTISGYCEMLNEALADETDRAKVQTIAEQVKRCQKIIRDALDYARGPADAPEPTDINALIKNTVTMMDYITRQARVKVVTDLADNLPPLNLDRDKMQQVFFNLLRNACEAMNGSGEIYISTRRTENSIRIALRDTGDGIPQKRLNQIFEPFYTTKEPGKGTGLGLAICRSIVREYGGKITARNAPEAGAEFMIELPLLD